MGAVLRPDRWSGAQVAHATVCALVARLVAMVSDQGRGAIVLAVVFVVVLIVLLLFVLPGPGGHGSGQRPRAVSAEPWPTVGWSVMAVGALLLVVWIWLRDQRR